MGQKYKNENLIDLAKQLYQEVGCFDESTFCKRYGIKQSILWNHFTIRLKSESDHRRYTSVGYNYQIDNDNLDFETREKLGGDYWSNFMTLADIDPYSYTKESVIEEALGKVPKDGSKFTPSDWKASLAPVIQHFGNSWNVFANEVERAKKQNDAEKVKEKKEGSDSSPEEESLDDFVAEIQGLRERFESRYPNLVLNFIITNKE